MCCQAGWGEAQRHQRRGNRASLQGRKQDAGEARRRELARALRGHFLPSIHYLGTLGHPQNAGGTRMGVESREAGGNGSRGDRDPGDMLTAEEENERSPARQPGWQQHLPGEPEGVGGRADVPATTTVIISAFSGEGRDAQNVYIPHPQCHLTPPMWWCQEMGALGGDRVMTGSPSEWI